jgi:hypothetical protein
MGRRNVEPEGWIDLTALDLKFSGQVWFWRGPAPFYFFTVPDEASLAIRAVSADVSYGWGMIPVTVQLGDTDFRTAMFPKDGRYVVPVKAVVRQAEGLADGDIVTMHLSIWR